MTQTASRTDGPKPAAAAKGDPLDDLLDDMQDKAAPPTRSASSAGSNAWWFALAATLVWIAAVVSFVWGYYALPFDWAAAREAVGSRFEAPDWLMIGAVLIAPVMLIWTIAAMFRRAAQMRAESRHLAGAALKLARATETAQRRGDVLLPGPSLIGEISSPSPGHFRREVERATHAISALHAQMSAIEEALANQSASIDAAADRAEARARAITETLSAEREELQRVADELAAHKRAVFDAAGASASAGSEAVRLGALTEHARETERHVESASARLAAEAASLDALGGERNPRDATREEDIVDLSLSADRSAVEPSAIETAPERPAARDEVDALRSEMRAARSALRWPRAEDFAPETEEDAAANAAEASDPESPLASQMRQRHLEALRAEMADLHGRGPEEARRDAPADDGRVDPFGKLVADETEPRASAPAAPRASRDADDSGNAAPLGAAIGAVGAAVGAAGSMAKSGSESSAESGADALDERLNAALAADAEEGGGAPEPAAPADRGAPPRREDARAGGGDGLSFPPPRPLNWPKLIRAANFPSSDDDTETLDALYEVLTDAQTAAMLQASEDTLAALADLNLYMEDFAPARATAADWSAYLDGGDGVAPGVDAPADVGRITARLNSDPGFRRLLERFAERYEGMAKRMRDETGEDSLLPQLADTRSGRAYMMVGKALGRF